VPNGFSPKQIKGAQALARGLSQVAAAREAGVARNTLILWLKKPEFRRKVHEFSKKAEQAESEVFVEVTKTRVRAGAVTSNELIELFSEIVRDEECRLGDRIRAGEALARWLGLGESKRYQQPPVLPSKPFSNSELGDRLDTLKAKAIVASEFLVEQAVQIAADGGIQEASAVLSKSLDLANDCVADVPLAANTLAKEGFIVLSPAEYSRLLPDGQKSNIHLLQPLNFERAFAWRWMKRQKFS
jgi:hypothetical protein